MTLGMRTSQSLCFLFCIVGMVFSTLQLCEGPALRWKHFVGSEVLRTLGDVSVILSVIVCSSPSFHYVLGARKKVVIFCILGLCTSALKHFLYANYGSRFFPSHPLSSRPCSSPVSVLCPYDSPSWCQDPASRTPGGFSLGTCADCPHF